MDKTKPWSNAESLMLKVLDSIHGFSDSSMFPCCKNILYSFPSLVFQILFDQAQRSVRQQLHNFVKE